MRRIELSPQAGDDLDRFGYAQADKFRSALFETFLRLSDNPFLGESLSDLISGARIFRRPPPCRIVYRADDTTLTILRIFHGQQDYERLLE